jgi:hypothetical protein
VNKWLTKIIWRIKTVQAYLITSSCSLGYNRFPSAVTFNYRYMRCAQFGLWQGVRRAHTPQWVCNGFLILTLD